MKNEYPIPNIQQLFLFLFSRFDTRNERLGNVTSQQLIEFTEGC